MEIKDVVLDWLRSGKDDANDIVDLPWEVKQLEPNLYVAEHPKMPFTLLVSFGAASYDCWSRWALKRSP